MNESYGTEPYKRLAERLLQGSEFYSHEEMQRFRSIVAQAHRWIGLAAGLLIVFLAATGAAIAFLPQLNAVLYPGLMTTTPCPNTLPVDRLISAARAAHRESRPTYVYLYGSASASVMVRFGDSEQVYLDACTAKVLGNQPRYGGVLGSLEGLHKFRFAGSRFAMPIIGTGALLLASLFTIGGVFMWWPRRKAVNAPNIRLRGRALSLNLHTTLGLYASLFFFVAAASALPLSLAWAKAALFAVTASKDMTDDAPLPPIASSSAAAKAGSMEGAWVTARRTFGGPFQWASLRIPARGEPIEVGIVLANAPNGEARNYVYVDPRTGRVVEDRPYGSLNAGSKLYYWALALHTGRAGGIFLPILMVASMTVLIIVVYAGIDSYLRKAARRLRSGHSRSPGSVA